MSWIAFIVLIIALISANKTPKIMGIAILTATLGITVLSRIEISTLFYGIQENIPILVLILLAPLITIPLKLSGYLNKIVSVMTELKNNPDRAFLSILAILFVLAPILNVGSIRVTQELVKDIHFKPKFLTKAYINGYLSAIVWSPYFATVAIVLYLFDVSLSSYILIGLAFAIIQTLTGYLLFHFNKQEHQGYQSHSNDSPEELKRLYRITAQFFGLILLLIGFLILLEYVTSLPMLLLVSLSAISIPVLWGVIARQLKVTFQETKNFISSVINSSNEIVLFLSAGLLGSALKNSPFAEGLNEIFQQIASLSVLLFGITIILLVIFFTVVGIHQLVIVPILIIQVQPDLVGIHPLALAFIFTVAWGLSVALSPVSATNMLVSNMLRAKWWQVGFKWNGVYVVVSAFIGLAIFFGLHLVTL
ncbi:hypothetical protein [Gracilibacillus dipsosauri]|uniref:hypothetical protein n=1 Tax=Gracilibacillus dipsosauri TaxID=178340 RepID=UPI0024095FE7